MGGLIRNLVTAERAHSCFFRSSVEPPYRKALVQITGYCNLRCAHCFLSDASSNLLTSRDIEDIIIPKLTDCRVVRVTLTGGEPFLHPEAIRIVKLFRDTGMPVTVCTNGTCLTLEQMDTLSALDKVHINVSLDGFRPTSHGVFRGNENSFSKTVDTICQLGKRNLLHGILVTPNNLATISEYAELCNFAIENGATYVLMNPLSGFGRGVNSKHNLGAATSSMEKIMHVTEPFSNRLQLVYVRFPNDKLPLASCEAGNIIYVFANGKLAICPYLVFAAKTPNSLHNPDEFIVGDILKDENIAERLDSFKFQDRFQVGKNARCLSCEMNATCGKGCPASVIAAGQRIESVDAEVCPNVRPKKV